MLTHSENLHNAGMRLFKRSGNNIHAGRLACYHVPVFFKYPQWLGKCTFWHIWYLGHGISVCFQGLVSPESIAWVSGNGKSVDRSHNLRTPADAKCFYIQYWLLKLGTKVRNPGVFLIFIHTHSAASNYHQVKIWQAHRKLTLSCYKRAQIYPVL